MIMSKRRVVYEYTDKSGRIAHGSVSLSAEEIRHELDQLRLQYSHDPQFRLRPGRNFSESVWFYENMPALSPNHKFPKPRSLNTKPKRAFSAKVAKAENAWASVTKPKSNVKWQVLPLVPDEDHPA